MLAHGIWGFVYGRLKTIYGYESIARVVLLCFFYSSTSLLYVCDMATLVVILIVFGADCPIPIWSLDKAICNMSGDRARNESASWKCSMRMSSMMNVHKLHSTWIMENDRKTRTHIYTS